MWIRKIVALKPLFQYFFMKKRFFRGGKNVFFAKCYPLLSVFITLNCLYDS